MDPRSSMMHGTSSGRRSSRMPLRSSYSLERDPLMERGGGAGVPGDPYMSPRERSLDRCDMTRHSRTRDRSLDRSVYLRDDHVGYRDKSDALLDDPIYRERPPSRATMGVNFADPSSGSINPAYSRDSYIMELQARLNGLQSQYSHPKRELDATTQKLGSSMHSIKTF